MVREINERGEPELPVHEEGPGQGHADGPPKVFGAELVGGEELGVLRECVLVEPGVVLVDVGAEARDPLRGFWRLWVTRLKKKNTNTRVLRPLRAKASGVQTTILLLSWFERTSICPTTYFLFAPITQPFQSSNLSPWQHNPQARECRESPAK